jgi:hypothetical protein
MIFIRVSVGYGIGTMLGWGETATVRSRKRV